MLHPPPMVLVLALLLELLQQTHIFHIRHWVLLCSPALEQKDVDIVFAKDDPLEKEHSLTSVQFAMSLGNTLQ